MEDLTNKDYVPVQFGKHKKGIESVLFVEELNMLLAGDQDGRVIQYHYKNNSWDLVKDYGNLRINGVLCCVRIGHLVIFGGYDSHSLRVVDVKKMEILGDPYKTAIFQINSLLLCDVSDEKMLLSVCGYGSSYSPDTSDILDITDLIKQYKLDSEKILKEGGAIEIMN